MKSGLAGGLSVGERYSQLKVRGELENLTP